MMLDRDNWSSEVCEVEVCVWLGVRDEGVMWYPGATEQGGPSSGAATQ